VTLSTILADLYRRLRYQSTPATDVVTRLTAFVNETHEDLLAMPGLSPLLYGTMTVASVANQARYGLASVAQVRAVTETTNDSALQWRSLAWYRSTNPDPASNTGTPLYVVPLGIVAVAQVPASTGTGLWVASSSASDTVPTATIDAIRVGGYPHSPSAATLNGTTRVAVGGGSALTDYIDVTQFALSAACVGDVTLYDAASAGNVLAVIPRGQTTSRYWGFILSPTPTTAITYTADIEHEVQPLSASTDEPLLPPRFHRLLAIGARMKEYEYQEDERFQSAVALYVEGRKALLYAVTCPPEYVAVPGSRLESTGSNLGPMYPEGRW
jgi:hypothetical protein